MMLKDRLRILYSFFFVVRVIDVGYVYKVLVEQSVNLQCLHMGTWLHECIDKRGGGVVVYGV